MAEVISLLTDEEDKDDDADEDTLAPTNAVTVPPAGTLFWIDESDIFQCSRIHISFTIQGAPVALSRPRIRFGYRLFSGRVGFGRPLYNPSQRKLTLFRQVLVSMITSTPSNFLLPLMEPSVPLEAVITFRNRRPNSHFVNSKRNRGLRTTAPRTYVVGKLDLESLVKFTLDAIGGVIYVTDGQICYISCRKVWDEGQGSTTCVVSKLEV
jgi:Holliday junction resolvase RusA-like endonuclease